MKKAIKFIVIFSVFTQSLYLTLYLFSNNITNLLLDNIFIFLYFFLMGYIVFKILAKFCLEKRLKLKETMVIMLVSFALTITYGNLFEINIYTDNVIKIVATGEKNNAAESNEVWITEILADNTPIELDSIILPDEWYLNDGNLVTYPASDIANELDINIPAAKQIEIEFIKHPWSGKVQIYLEDELYEEIDLYSVQSDNIICLIDGNKIDSSILVVLSYLFCFILLVNVFIFFFKIRSILKLKYEDAKHEK